MALVLDSSAQDLLFREARTANTFTTEPVTDEQVRAIYDVVRFAPTAMNSQPLRVVLVRSPQARQRLVEHMNDGNKTKTSTAPLTAILAAHVDFHDRLAQTFPHAVRARDMFAGDDAMRTEFAKFNATLQVGYFILGVRAAGLAAGPMTGYDQAGIEKDFFREGDHKVLAVVNIGKPGEDAWSGRLPRLAYDEVVTTV